MDTVLQDLRYSLRMLSKKPGFTVIAVLALALGIGANSAIFSVVNTVLLRPLPYENPDKLVLVWTYFGPDLPQNWVSGPELADMRERSTMIEEFAALTYPSVSLTASESPSRCRARPSPRISSLRSASSRLKAARSPKPKTVRAASA